MAQGEGLLGELRSRTGLRGGPGYWGSAHFMCQKWRNSLGLRLFPERTLLNHVQPFIITRGLEAKLSLHPLHAWFLES